MKTKVIFRKDKKTGEIIAVFSPRIAHDRNGWLCVAYVHVGQHTAACPHHVISATVPASPEEYAALRRELESAPYGYEFETGLKFTRTDFEARKLDAMPIVEVSKMKDLPARAAHGFTLPNWSKCGNGHTDHRAVAWVYLTRDDGGEFVVSNGVRFFKV